MSAESAPLIPPPAGGNTASQSEPAHDAVPDRVGAGTVSLRDVRETDLAIFFEQQLDPQANQMAAFAAANPKDQATFLARWRRNLADPTITIRTVLAGEQVAGHVLCFELFGQPSVGYWYGREYWGKGIATRALRLFIQEVPTRPLYARAAKDNNASIRVLQHGGFVLVDEEMAFANARMQTIPEVILRLD